MLSEKDKQLADELRFTQLPAEEQVKRLRQFQETLRIKVGLRLEQELDDKQLEQVVKVLEQSGSDKAEEWLASYITNYKEIAESEEKKLIEDVQKNTALIKSMIEKL